MGLPRFKERRGSCFSSTRRADWSMTAFKWVLWRQLYCYRSSIGSRPYLVSSQSQVQMPLTRSLILKSEQQNPKQVQWAVQAKLYLKSPRGYPYQNHSNAYAKSAALLGHPSADFLGEPLKSASGQIPKVAARMILLKTTPPARMGMRRLTRKAMRRTTGVKRAKASPSLARHEWSFREHFLRTRKDGSLYRILLVIEIQGHGCPRVMERYWMDPCFREKMFVLIVPMWQPWICSRLHASHHCLTRRGWLFNIRGIWYAIILKYFWCFSTVGTQRCGIGCHVDISQKKISGNGKNSKTILQHRKSKFSVYDLVSQSHVQVLPEVAGQQV